MTAEDGNIHFDEAITGRKSRVLVLDNRLQDADGGISADRVTVVGQLDEGVSNACLRSLSVWVKEEESYFPGYSLTCVDKYGVIANMWDFVGEPERDERGCYFIASQLNPTTSLKNSPHSIHGDRLYVTGRDKAPLIGVVLNPDGSATLGNYNLPDNGDSSEGAVIKPSSAETGKGLSAGLLDRADGVSRRGYNGFKGAGRDREIEGKPIRVCNLTTNEMRKGWVLGDGRGMDMPVGDLVPTDGGEAEAYRQWYQAEPMGVTKAVQEPLKPAVKNDNLTQPQTRQTERILKGIKQRYVDGLNKYVMEQVRSGEKDDVAEIRWLIGQLSKIDDATFLSLTHEGTVTDPYKLIKALKKRNRDCRGSDYGLQAINPASGGGYDQYHKTPDYGSRREMKEKKRSERGGGSQAAKERALDNKRKRTKK